MEGGSLAGKHTSPANVFRINRAETFAAACWCDGCSRAFGRPAIGSYSQLRAATLSSRKHLPASCSLFVFLSFSIFVRTGVTLEKG